MNRNIQHHEQTHTLTYSVDPGPKNTEFLSLITMYNFYILTFLHKCKTCTNICDKNPLKLHQQGPL